MTAVHFYHLTTTPLERALPKLLEKAYSTGKRVLLTLESEAQMDHLNKLLWTYDANQFLPHGSVKEGQTNAQPILLSTAQDNQNSANMLFIASNQPAQQPEAYERVIDMFDGGNDTHLQAARERWKAYKAQGISLVYHQQADNGGWQQKATA